MTEINLKPAKGEASIIRIPNYKPFELTMNFDSVYHAINANVSLKAMTIAAFLSMAEERQSSFPTLDDLFNMVGTAYPEAWVEQGLVELMERNLAFWCEQDGETHYILTADFSAVI